MTIISIRIATLTMQLTKIYTLQIIQTYALTISHKKEEIEEFYKDLCHALNSKSPFLYIIADFNAKVGKIHNQGVGNY